MAVLQNVVLQVVVVVVVVIVVELADWLVVFGENLGYYHWRLLT